EAQLTNQGRVLRPRALDVDAVGERVHSRARRAQRLVEERDGIAAAPFEDRIAPAFGGTVRVTPGGRAEHDVVEQVDLSRNSEVVGNPNLRVETQPEIGSGLSRVLAADQIGRIVA